MQETLLQFLGREIPLEKGQATHSRILGLPWWLKWYRIHLKCRRPQFDSWIGTIPWRRDRLPTPGFLGFPGGSDGKESACNAGDLGSIPGLGRSPGGEHGDPLHGQRSLAGCSPWGHKKSDTTEQLPLSLSTCTIFYSCSSNN